MRIAIRNPSPSSPSRFAAGNARVRRRPARRSSTRRSPASARAAPPRSPGVPASTTNAEIPAWPASRIRLREHGVEPARPPAFVMKRFDPSSTYSSPVAARGRPHRGRVRARSRLGQRIRAEPLPGRERAAGSAPAARRDPASFSPSEPSSCTARISPLVAQTFETSSIAIERQERAGARCHRNPPRRRARRCRARGSSSTTSHGNSCDSSISAARGAIRSRASVRTSSRISSCSSVSGSQGIVGF